MPDEVRVLVCGGRDYDDAKTLDFYLTQINWQRPFTTLIHGAARGADTLAARWAERNAIPTEAYPADWDRDGKSAGPIRNLKMLAEGKPDLVIAFPGGRGTAHMKKIARASKVQVVEIPKLP